MLALDNSMESIGSRVLVRFNESHNKVFKIGNIELIKPDIWQYNSGESDDKMDGKVNKLLVNPQIAEVVATNQKHKLSKGDMVFVHYMAYEWKDENSVNMNGVECTMIDGLQVFFKIVDDKIVMQPDMFLGEVIHEEKMTMSGIIISVDSVRKSATIKITNKPKSVKREWDSIDVGMIVNTVDDFQYPITYNGNNYVVLKSNEIAGILEEV